MGRNAVGVIYGEGMPSGIYGTRISDAMLALTATAVREPVIHRLLMLTLKRISKRFRLNPKSLLRGRGHPSRRRTVARSTGTTWIQSSPRRLPEMEHDFRHIQPGNNVGVISLVAAWENQRLRKGIAWRMIMVDQLRVPQILWR